MGRWRQAAAILALSGGFADASLAHPDRVAAPDLALFACALASVPLFLALGEATRTRLVLAATVALASAVAVVVDVAGGVTRVEVALGVADVALRLALMPTLAVLALRHPRADHSHDT